MLLRVSWAGGLALGESALFLPIEFDELLKAKTFSWSLRCKYEMNDAPVPTIEAWWQCRQSLVL